MIWSSRTSAESDPVRAHLPLALDVHAPGARLQLHVGRLPRDERRGRLGALHVARDGAALHAGGDVDRVADEGELAAVRAEHARRDRAAVDADADLDGGRVGRVGVDGGVLRGADGVDGEAGQSGGVVAVLVVVEVGGGHVGVADDVDVGHAVLCGEGVESGVESAEQIGHFSCGKLAADLGEADDIGEED